MTIALHSQGGASAPFSTPTHFWHTPASLLSCRSATGTCQVKADPSDPGKRLCTSHRCWKDGKSKQVPAMKETTPVEFLPGTNLQHMLCLSGGGEWWQLWTPRQLFLSPTPYPEFSKTNDLFYPLCFLPFSCHEQTIAVLHNPPSWLLGPSQLSWFHSLLVPLIARKPLLLLHLTSSGALMTPVLYPYWSDPMTATDTVKTRGPVTFCRRTGRRNGQFIHIFPAKFALCKN